MINCQTRLMKSVSNWEPVLFSTFLGSCLGRLLSGCSEPRPYALRAGSLGMGGGPATWSVGAILRSACAVAVA